MRTCAYEKCGVAFEPSTHNQRYHTSECCRKATNSRIMEDYYAKKARRKGSVRFCKSAGCKTVLSRYNDSDTCGPCESKETESARRELLRSLVGSR